MNHPKSNQCGNFIFFLLLPSREIGVEGDRGEGEREEGEGEKEEREGRGRRSGGRGGWRGGQGKRWVREEIGEEGKREIEGEREEIGGD